MMNAAAAIEADIDRANNHRSSMLANAWMSLVLRYLPLLVRV
jgi:hypothetical protein